MSGAGLQGRLTRLCQKELKETIRDRRTIVTLLMMPLLVYPLLSMALNRFLLSSGAPEGDHYTIGVETDDQGQLLQSWLADPRSSPPREIVRASGGEVAEFKVVNTVDVPPERSVPPVDALTNGTIDVAAEIVVAADQTPKITFFAFRGDGASQSARRVLVERLQWLKLGFAESFAAAANDDYQPPLEVDVQDVGDVEQTPLLATVIPLVLVLMTITGAVYPAIDLTAGERERGTMEALMASPVPRFYVLFSKYTAVVTVALLTALANLLAMFTTLWFGGLLPLLTGSDAFPWVAILQILGLLVLFSGFYSAVLLSLTSFAKSFKEAQAYLIPVMLLSLAPGMLSLMPGVTMSGAMAIAPLINIVLLARDLLSGQVQPAAALAAVVSTGAYAAAALAIAAKLFGSDAVTRTSEQSISSLFRRPAIASPVPSPQAAAMMMALLVPIYFVVSNALVRWLQTYRDSLTVSSQLMLNAIALIATFGAVPLIATYWGRNQYRTTYRMNWPTWVSLIAAAVMGLGAWVIAHESFVLAQSLGIGMLDEARIEQVLRTVGKLREAPPLMVLAAFALTPAVVEELCFRGYLFSALSRVLSPARVIVVTAVLFGLFHVLTGNTLLIERFIPSTLMGLILGWIAYRTGSVLPGMAVHFVHNALLMLVAYYHDRISILGSDINSQAHLPVAWIVVATAIAGVCGLVIWWNTPSPASARA
jgi:sodium transport system permease protein